jgi:hypothetical protein
MLNGSNPEISLAADRPGDAIRTCTQKRRLGPVRQRRTQGHGYDRPERVLQALRLVWSRGTFKSKPSSQS